MNIEQVREYTLSLPGVTEDQPFGDDIITFRLEGKIFVCLWIGGGKYDMKDGEPRLALKLAPERNEEIRAQFSAVTPAYHWNKGGIRDVDNIVEGTNTGAMYITSSWMILRSKNGYKSPINS